MDAYQCKCMSYRTLSHTEGTNLYKIIGNNRNYKSKKGKKGHCFLCFMTESRTKVTWFTHTNYEVRDYERSNKGNLYGSMFNKPKR